MTIDIPAPNHGGNPLQLPDAEYYTEMLDLATGINPWPWPVPCSCLAGLAKLPYHSSELQQAAAKYYDVYPQQLLPTSGSQAVIQLIPQMLAVGRVLLAGPAYEEHAFRWQQAGHECVFFPHDQPEKVAELIRQQGIEYLVLVSPNNPTGQMYTEAQLSQWQQLLPENGFMLVDQAYADVQIESLCTGLLSKPKVILLRSTGKFFGLPGLRLGFALGDPQWLTKLDAMQGPWAVNSLAQSAGAVMLADRAWQHQMRQTLSAASARQANMLGSILSGWVESTSSTPLFNSFELPLDRGLLLQQLCYKHGLSVRVYQWQGRAYMRWGLAADEAELHRRLSSLGDELSALTDRVDSHVVHG
jgi:cobalamin biosynthetic protein CobC